MGKPTGFLEYGRELPTRRPVPVRLRDWKEVYEPFPADHLAIQASRCMDCGIPFCNDGCPLGNLIPDWNDLVYRDHWQAAIERLHATNNFPEFTGRLCPAPCESACVLGINADPVTIKQVEVSIIDRAWDEGWVEPVPPDSADRQAGRRRRLRPGRAGRRPAADPGRPRRTVYERADRIGGLLRYGIPEFKMEKRVLDRRLDQMRAEGTAFVPVACEVGADLSVEELWGRHDAVVLAAGATVPRDLPIPGRELAGIHQAMEYLPWPTGSRRATSPTPPITAAGKRVVIIGGGDTGADCLGTAHRQGAASVHQFEIMPRPPDTRSETTPWPPWPLMFRTSSAHEEGGERVFAVNTERFVGDDDGHVRALRACEVVMTIVRRPAPLRPRRGHRLRAAVRAGAAGPGVLRSRAGLPGRWASSSPSRGNVAREGVRDRQRTACSCAATPGRGQSLIVWAIAEGRSCAAAVDRYLIGSTMLPAPVPAP